MFQKKYRAVFNKQLENYLDKEISEVKDPFIKYCYSIIKDFSLSEGKRLRPLALILSYISLGGKNVKNIYMPAVVIELHHTYSLILDDIMDEDDYRRNKPSVHKRLKDYFKENFQDLDYKGSLFNKKSSKFAVSYALMLGNLTNILSKRAIFESEFPDLIKYKALNLIEKADEEMYHGQMMDIYFEQKERISEAEYLKMIKLKTAVLFGLAFELGPLFSEKDEHTRYLFKEFGMKSALSFQILDDMIDLTTGKGHELGSDIKRGKKTLLMIKNLGKGK